MAKEKRTVAANREAALKAIEKQFGKDKIHTAAEFEPPVIDAIPTGSVGIDKLTGVGGYPRGRIIEIYGPNASGKTTLTLHAIANAQKKGLRCAFVDAEFTFDKVYSSAIGVDLETLDLFRPNSGEEALQIVELLTESSSYGLVVIDSVAALVPQAEVDGEIGDSHVGLQARLMSQALRKLTSKVGTTGTTLIFLNQLRSKIGVMFGSPETTSGGNSLEFYASFRLDIRRIGSIKKGEEVIGNRTRVKVVKNKLAGTAANSVEFDMYSNNEFGAGISYVGEIFEAGVNLNLVEKSGAWYSYQGERIGHGKDNAVLTLKTSPDIFATLETQVRQAYGIKDPEVTD